MPQPGLTSQHKVRTAARIAGIVVTALGVIIVVGSLLLFISAFSGDYDPFEEGGIPRPVFGVVGLGFGGFLTVFGLNLLKAGYGGAALRYAAGETMPVVKDSLDHLKGEQATEQPAAGPSCGACGVRNDESARFCDGCGQARA